MTKNKCDKQLQVYIKKNNKTCLLCSNKCQVGHHYFLTKNSSFLRYYLPNIIPLCNKHHFILHRRQDVSIIVGILKVMGMGWFIDLESKKKLPIKTNKKYYKEVYEKLS